MTHIGIYKHSTSNGLILIHRNIIKLHLNCMYFCIETDKKDEIRKAKNLKENCDSTAISNRILTISLFQLCFAVTSQNWRRNKNIQLSKNWKGLIQNANRKNNSQNSNPNAESSQSVADRPQLHNLWTAEAPNSCSVTARRSTV
jgi:hypothetical protein